VAQAREPYVNPVLGTHESVQLQGGPDFDEEETRDRVLAHAHDQAGREPGSLRVIAFERDGMPSGTDLRVDPSTGRVELLGDPNPTRSGSEAGTECARLAAPRRPKQESMSRSETMSAFG
jgi:hypothetical protein